MLTTAKSHLPIINHPSKRRGHGHMTHIRMLKVKVKFSHTRYRALGPELIPVYRQSARR